MPLGLHLARPEAAEIEGNAKADRGGIHSGKLSRPQEEVADEPRALRRGEVGGAEVEPDDELVAQLEARRAAAEGDHRPDDLAGHGEEERCQRELPHQERRHHPAVPDAEGALRSAFLHRGSELYVRGEERGQEADEECGQQGEERTEEERAPVEAGLEEDGIVRDRQESEEETLARPRRQDAEQASRHAERETFQEDLEDEASARPAEGHPDGELPLALRAPGQQQAGHVAAGDEEEKRRGEGEDEHGDAQDRLHPVAVRGDGEDERLPRFVPVRPLPGQRPRQALDAVGRLLQTDARLQAGEDVVAAVGRARGAVVLRDVEVRLEGDEGVHPESAHRAVETGGGDADDGARLALQEDGPAHDPGVRRETPLPVGVREDGNQRLAGPAVRRSEETAQRGLEPERAEVVAGDDLGPGALGPLVHAKAEREHVEPAGALEDVGVAPERDVVLGVDRAGTSRIPAVDADEAPRVADPRHRIEHRAAHPRVDRDVDADAEAQAENGHEGEEWPLAREAERESKIVEHEASSGSGWGAGNEGQPEDGPCARCVFAAREVGRSAVPLRDLPAEDEPDVLPPLAKGRNEDLDRVQPEAQVLAEAAAGDLGVEVGVRGAQDAHARLQRPAAPDPLELPRLQEAQEPGLEARGGVADFVEEERPAVGQLEAAHAVGPRVGEGALHVAEELALEDALGEPSRVHGEEGARSAGRGRVQEAGDEALPGAVLARDEDGGVGGADALDQVQDGLHRPGLGHEGGKPFPAKQGVLGLEPKRPAHGRGELQLGTQRGQQPDVLPGLLDEVLRPPAHRLDRQLDAPPGGHDHDGDGRRHLLEPLQEVQPLAARGRVAAVVHVDEDEIRRLGLHGGERGCRCPGGVHLEAFRLEQQAKALPDVGLVVGDEDACGQAGSIDHGGTCRNDVVRSA